MPPIPPPQGLHPLIVHVPIALLNTTLLFLVLALFPTRYRGVLAALALMLMVLGTAGTWVAVATGEDSERNAEAVPASKETFEHHEELGETTRRIFTALTIVFAALVFAWRKLPARILPLLLAVFLFVYGWALTILANTSHHGGLLVHEYGVRAPQTTGGEPAHSHDAGAESHEGGGGH